MLFPRRKHYSDRRLRGASENPSGPIATFSLIRFLVPLAVVVTAPTGLRAQVSGQGAGAGSDDAMAAVRIPAGHPPLRLDGLLGEEAWLRASPLTGLRQREPFQGEAATQATEVRMVYDDATLYVGITALDSDPDGIVSRIMQRDRVLSGGGFGGLSPAGDDVVAILLDTFGDRRNAVVLATNPNGAFFDALVANDGGEVNADWNGVWEVAATRIPGGWSAEFAIPWRSLRYAPDAEQEWGFNVYRSIPRLQEEMLWKAWARDGGGFDRVSQAGPLVGLRDLPRASLTVEAKPFLLGGQSRVRDGTVLDYSAEWDAGLDLKSEIRPGLLLDLTFNTDFAQVEVDDQQVNLTRFDLFFPEKRDFFLENSGIFEFGQGGFMGPPPFLMFFSRNIGIGPDGEVPILGGARLTGRAGDQTLGVLSLATDDVPGQERELFNVVRVKRDVGTAAYVGAMVTDRRSEGAASTMGGLDFQYYPHPTLETSAFVARSSTDGPGGEGWVYQGALNWTMDRWGGFLRFFSVDPGTRAASGFITRTDIRTSSLNLRRTFRPGILDIRRIDIRPGLTYQSTTTGRFQDREVDASFSTTFNSGDRVSFSVAESESQVDDPFPLAGQVDIPAGRYALDSWSVSASTTTARPWRVSASYREGDFFGGDLVNWSGSLTLTPGPAFSVTGQFNRNEVEVPGGAFTADIISTRITWALSPRIVTNALVQYNRLTDDILTNVRFNFIHRPGSDFFLVLTDERGVEGDLWALQDQGLVAKLTWLFRL